MPQIEIPDTTLKNGYSENDLLEIIMRYTEAGTKKQLMLFSELGVFIGYENKEWQKQCEKHLKSQKSSPIIQG